MQNRLFKKELVFVIIALFTMTSVVPSIVGEGEEYFYANQDIAVQNGGIIGDYTDTFSSDDNYEAISERESGGKPLNRYSYLEHKWTFELTGSFTSIDSYIEAYHTANNEGDDFVFAYSINDADYTDMLTITKTSDDDSKQGFSLPSSLSGTIYVRVKDTDQTPGRKTLDTVYIDHMYILAMTAPDNTPPVISNVASSNDFNNGIEILTTSASSIEIWENQSSGWENVEDIIESPTFRIQVCNIDYDPENEIVCALGSIIVLDFVDGEFIKTWNSTYIGQLWDVDVGDVDDDGINEIITGQGTDKLARIFKFNGISYEQIWVSSFQGMAFSFSCKTGDITNDGKIDFVYNNGNTIMVYENKSGTFTNTFNISGAGNCDNIDIGDANNDGSNDLIFCGADNKVHLVEWNDYGFEETWSSADMGYYVQDCRIGDIDNDGYNEIVGGGDEMYVWEEQSDNWVLAWSSSGYGGNGMKNMIVLDVDGDGKNEFTSADGTGWHIWGHVSGNSYVEEFNSGQSGGGIHVGAGDIDMDRGIQATITWNTDEPSDSVVNYGTITELGNTISDSSLVTNHQINLNQLMPDTTYYFEVQSTDTSDNTATDDNNGNYYNFTIILGPVISNIASDVDVTSGIEILTDKDSSWKVWEYQNDEWINTWTSPELPWGAIPNAVGDVDDDSDNEVIIGHHAFIGQSGGGISVWEQDDTGGWYQFWNSSDTKRQIFKSVIADADSDGINEILRCSSSEDECAAMYKWNATSETYDEIWKGYTGTNVGYSCDVGDVNHDGIPELITSGAGYDGQSINVWEFQGGYNWLNTVNISGHGMIDNLRIADADNDGYNEIIWCSGPDNQVYVVKYIDGDYVEIWQSGDMGGSTQDCAVGDVDNDGENEIVSGACTVNKMFVWEYQGGNNWDLVWSSEEYGCINMDVITIDDLDNDGLNEFTSAEGFYGYWFIFQHVSGNQYELCYQSLEPEGTGIFVQSGDVDNDAGDLIAAITWTTDELSDSVVNYGTTIELGNTVSDSSLVTNHRITINQLLPDTTYYFEVQSTDASDNTATDDNNGDYFTFTTEQDTTPPIITNVQTTSITHNSATITWDTDESSNSCVNYGTTTALGDKEFNFAMATSHLIILSNLLPETTYYYEVQSTDIDGNTATDNNSGAFYTFTTNQAPSNVMHVYSIDMWYTQAKNKFIVYTKVKIVDTGDNAVEGADVYLELVDPVSNAYYFNDVTGSDGTVTFVHGPTPKSGTYISTVTNVAKDGWIYNPDDNMETSENLAVP